jgi:hypothetical protein
MSFTSITHRFKAAAVLGMALAWAGFASAQLTTPGALPGGVTVTDSDSGNGQAWGRPGGRNITFSVNTPAAFDALTWGVASGTNPSLAFDGSVTPGSPEIMTFQPGLSNTAAGRAVWMGTAILPTIVGNVSTPTRFTLTITPGRPMVFQGGGVNPGIDVLAGGTTFTANFLFEMQYVGLPGADGQWHPVLTKYDAITLTLPGSPPSTNEGPVMTGVTTGFYFSSETGMSLEQHDAHIAALVNGVRGDTSFMRIEMTNRLPAIQNDLGEIKNKVVNEIPGSLSQILSQLQQPGGNTNAATRDDVNQAKQDLQEILLILFGLAPCPPEAGPLCTTAKFISHLSTQASVDLVKQGVDGILIGLNRVETGVANAATQASVNALSSKVDALQGSVDGVASTALVVVATQVDAASSKHARFIVRTTVDGQPVAATLSRVTAFLTGSPAALAQNVTGNATVVPLGNGLHDVTIELVKGVSDGSAFLFEGSFGNNALSLQGSALVAASRK